MPLQDLDNILDYSLFKPCAQGHAIKLCLLEEELNADIRTKKIFSVQNQGNSVD